ncbi:MAG: iron-sulfur cluster assembly scaffold protein [Fimbriimonadaceae bacterium]|nr:iron-sulfur cluster assembly scaffold protein [Fimbriimonadaceae bacterium]
MGSESPLPLGELSEIVFSTTVIEHNASPRNVGEFQGANRHGQVGMPGCGPYVDLWLRIDGDTISRASYRTYGCPAAVACASLVAEILHGWSVGQARALEARDIEVLLGGLPEGKGHCPEMAIEALRDALGDEVAKA